MRTRDLAILAVIGAALYFYVKRDELREGVIYISGTNLPMRELIALELKSRGIAHERIPPGQLANILTDPTVENQDLVLAVRGPLSHVKVWHSGLIPPEQLGTAGLEAAIAYASEGA